MEQIQPYLDYFAANPNWAIALIFLIAFGEALLIIGLVVPSTLVLVGAGALVGTGKLEFWPVMIATTMGCILGDQVSYWAGRIFGDRLRTFWPLSAYPQLVSKGEAFMKTHGGKSIALGRFVPGVKAVIPGIAGMFGMNQTFFLFINVTSGIVWAAAHLLPGVLLGQALSLAGELSGRLLVILLVLLVVLGVAGWLIRVISAGLMPYRKAVQGRISAWARGFSNQPMRRFGRAIAPQNPRSILVLLPLLLSPVLIVVLGDIVSGRMLEHAVGNLDYSIFNLFSETRSAPGDELLIRITMLGDDSVVFVTILGAALWLMAQRAWRTAAIVVATAAVAKVTVMATMHYLGPHMTGQAEVASLLQVASFPSDHTVMACVVFGTLALLLSRGMGRWTHALVAATCGIIVVAIAFSRLYLGVNWLSDVVGGLLLGAVFLTLFTVAIETWPARRIKPVGLALASLAAFLLIATFHITTNYDKSEESYVAVDKKATYSLAEWTDNAWQKTQTRRIDMSGKTEEIFVAQWLGSLPALQTALEHAGYETKAKWTWRDSFPYLDPNAPLDKLPPRPALHEGLKAKLTAVEATPNSPSSRATVRVFATNSMISGPTATPVYLVSFTQEVLRPRFHLFSVPSDQSATLEQNTAFVAKIAGDASVAKLSEKTIEGQTVTILQPKS
jgi:membrane protein DedA with SNARE-associated domain/membrane-associated phospholipid phosphatase